MDHKNFVKALDFSPKENTTSVFSKKYPMADNYTIEVNFKEPRINYGEKITSDSKTTQNFSQDENFVVLECVNRLLENGYKPENIVLEPTWKLGHQEKGRLDILVKKDNKAYLMIECKTFGKEYDKELKNLQKDGGQLFSYFQQDKNAEILMLYASELKNSKIIFENTFVKIEEEYKTTSSVKDFYEKWDKQTKNYGVWENPPYDFKEKLFTKNDLREFSEQESQKLFNEFASILRKHSVSDKPNAFNVIFNLFLAKLYDEAKGENDELEFHWRENDNPIDFQVRLYRLHKEGLFAFLKKEIEGIEDSDFQANSPEELLDKKKKFLKFNKLFDIKNVLDDNDFEQNHRVLKDVVKLLEKYQIRYPRKQQHLSDFFERLLTTGLKQEVGQYFTPPPITKFIVKSLPIKQLVLSEVNNTIAKLPAIIDYAVGSGHFITEVMEEYQDVINSINLDDIKFPIAKKEVASWQADPYNWAAKYVYGIEKDYRLVKAAKVGCYFYGDGVAQVIHGDGLDSFKSSKTYKGLLQDNANKPQFSLLLSNPPYSVNDCKDDLEYIGAQNDFELYPHLTDKSKDIECLFVERTKHLLKDDGVAAIILPSSILNNTGIQTKTREIILQYFDIIAIVELGGNTFMATNTNTVTLFLKRRNNQDTVKLKTYTDKFFTEFIDNSIVEIEKPVAKYIFRIWENISFEDYVSLLKKQPNQNIEKHEIYKEYRKKIKVKTEKEFWDKLLDTEKDKLHYFLLAYYQKDIVLVKSGEKDAEKHFLGYEFSNRRGNEGMHSMQGGKSIDEATQLYNAKDQNDCTKASSYIYNAFIGNKNLEIVENLKSNVSYVDLLDMLTFDRAEFQKEIKLAVKKKVKIESKWEIVKLGEIAQIDWGNTDLTKTIYKEKGQYNVYSATGLDGKTDFYEQEGEAIILSAIGARCGKCFYAQEKWTAIKNTIVIRNKEEVLLKYLFQCINNESYWVKSGAAQPFITLTSANAQKIPLPPKEIQQKIVSEIEIVEKKEVEAKEKIEKYKKQIENICLQSYSQYNKEKLSQLAITNPSKTEISNLDINTLISFVDMPSVSNDGYIANKIDKPYSEIKKGSYTYFREDDIIIAKITPCMENGKCALAANLTNGLALGSSEFHVIRANNDIIKTKYLFTLLNRKSIRIDAEKNMTGASGHRRVPIAFYENLAIPVPPIPEQQKIVAEIEKIEAEIADFEKQFAEIPQEKETVLKKYL